MKQSYQYQDKTFSLELAPTGKTYRATLGNKTVQVELVRVDAGQLHLLIDGQPSNAWVTIDGAKRWVTLNGQTLLLSKTGHTRKSARHEHHSAGQLLAPIPAQVRAVQTTPGASVSRGQTLIIVEAMKMEIKLAAPFDGRVKAVLVTIGQIVDKEQLLIEIEP